MDTNEQKYLKQLYDAETDPAVKKIIGNIGGLNAQTTSNPWYKTQGGAGAIGGLVGALGASLLGEKLPESLAYGAIGAGKTSSSFADNQMQNQEMQNRQDIAKTNQELIAQRLKQNQEEMEQNRLYSQQNVQANQMKMQELAHSRIIEAVKSGVLDAETGNKLLKQQGVTGWTLQNRQEQAGANKLIPLNIGNKQILVDPLTGETKQSYDIQRQEQSATMPSTVQEYEYFNKLNPEQQKRYLAIKRQSQLQSLGGEVGVYDPLQGIITQTFKKTPNPEQMPEFKGQQEMAKVQGKAQGELATALTSQASKIPSLEKTVQELSELGKKATYTKTGQLVDTIRRQLGMDVGEGAIARQEYISKVNNQILPLLRDTFGAQFTEREGETLKNTLGNPDISPKEKDAILNSFIEQKKRDIADTQRQINMTTPQTTVAQPQVNQPTTIGRFKIRMK